ncbi:AI-2E family transporter [Neobacillus piezotolerans]|uniref:AI-2E family transporter n=1 Tax=Neobacillus piezotolerans TaxID=2259171 RepID=A0A3D8GL96_9BACI|nr:AI-2E family transporter [Neobacillus piezotolerans]RDU35121.1 AI-2E family transporter [Neobacillus piezotolerans]
MNIQMKWVYRIAFFLLLLSTLFVLMKLKPFWIPAARVLGHLLVPFLTAGFITYLLHPVVEKLHARGVHRGIAVLLIYIVFFGGLGLALYKGIPALMSQIQELSASAPDFADHYRGMIASLEEKTKKWPEGMQERVDRGITGAEERVNSLFDIVLGGLAGFADSILTIMVIPFMAFYMLKDYSLLKRASWYMTPKKWRRQGIRFLHDVDESLGGYIRGQLLVCTIMGLISSLLFWLFGLRFPLLLGLVVALTNVIPYFGPIIGAIPAVVIAASSSAKLIFITLAIVFTLQFFEGNILSPYIVGKSLHMHPLLIILALLAGGEIGGIAGLIFAVPVLAILKVAALHAIAVFAGGHR